MSQLGRYDVNRRDEFEAVREPLYDFQTYANAGQTSLNFFQLPIGQSGKTIDDTNMQNAGTLPAPINFLIETIEVYFFPGVNPVTVENTAATAATASNFANDVAAVQESGSLDLFIGSKSYTKQAPLGRFPQTTRLYAQFGFGLQVKQAAGADETNGIYGDYAATTGKPYNVVPRIRLIPTQNFKVVLSWASAVALPSGVDGRIGVVLGGIQYRESQ
jgi:hypothetical protein